MSSPTISIALCTYNGAAHLQWQLESLANQSSLPDELVVSDDRSSDNSLKIVTDFAAAVPFRVHILTAQDQMGYRSNFLRAAEACRSDYIAFCDQDDIWSPRKLEVVRGVLTQRSPQLVYHGFNVVGPEGEFLREDVESRSPFREESNSPWSFPLGFSMVFSRKLVEQWRRMSSLADPIALDKVVAHDEIIWIVAWAIGSIAYIREALVDHRQHAANAFGVRQRDQSLVEGLSERLLRFPPSLHLLRVCLDISHSFLPGQYSEEGIGATEAMKAASLFDELAAMYALRSAVYASPSGSARLKAWCKAFRSGIYCAASENFFANRGALRDFVLGVLMGAHARRRGALQGDNSLRVGRPFPLV